MMSVNSTSSSALRPYEGRKENTDIHAQQFESEIFESGCVADTRQALRLVSNQSVALLPKYADGELASSVTAKPVALRPAEFSRSPVCSKPDGGEAIAQAATLRSLPKSVAIHSSGVEVQSQNESVNGQGKNTVASGLLVDLYDSRLDPSDLEFMPNILSPKQVDTREGVGSPAKGIG